ncbi:Niacin transporter NiaX [Caloramator mitchellensis]|uniref:Niacin transporter NiaX n=1 Tax=Caloramator mitchellensis TaxID=908809 RepID=A0A0R3JUL6_CALMK|nr:ECF transporter S component [Caloramator mitchellensis]KRQ87255.1 Niacin transporter NiaX [Caloramator mitchellensis]
MTKSSEITTAGLLAAISFMIPMYFGGALMVQVGPFTATIMSHVPTFLAMLISPLTGAMVGFASGLGFLLKLGPIAGSRGFMHIIIGFLGAYMIKKGRSYKFVLTALLPVHALLEALVVIPFGKFALPFIFTSIGIGTALHHTVDSIIAYVFARTLNQRAKLFKAIEIRN